MSNPWIASKEVCKEWIKADSSEINLERRVESYPLTIVLTSILRSMLEYVHEALSASVTGIGPDKRFISFA